MVKPVAAMADRLVADLTASPDGPWILFSQYDEPGSELMLVENFR